MIFSSNPFLEKKVPNGEMKTVFLFVLRRSQQVVRSVSEKKTRAPPLTEKFNGSTPPPPSLDFSLTKSPVLKTAPGRISSNTNCSPIHPDVIVRQSCVQTGKHVKVCFL